MSESILSSAINFLIKCIGVILLIICIAIILTLIACNLFDIKPARNNRVMQFLLNIFGMHHLSSSELAHDVFYKMHNMHSPQAKMIYIGGYSNQNHFIHDANTNYATYISMLTHGDAVFIELHQQTFNNLDTYTQAFDLIQYYKNIKPVSAYMLHINIADLVDISDDTINNISKRLLIASKSVYMPVYTIITGLETIFGFDDIAHYIADNNILIGWSDDIIDMFSNIKYSIHNIDDTFDKIADDIRIRIEKLCFRIAAQYDNKNTAMFADELINKLHNLRKFMTQVFGNQSAFFLRGMYFIGAQHGKMIGSNTLMLKHIALEELGKYKIDSNRSSTYMHRAIITILAAMYIALAMQYIQTLYRSDKIITYLDRIDRIRHENLDHQSIKDFILLIERIKNNELRTIIMPASLISMLQIRINYMLSYIYHKMIIENVFAAFNRIILELSADSNDISMMDYVQQSLNAYKLHHAIIGIGLDGSIGNMHYIIKRLFNLNMPNEYNKHTHLYKSSLKFGLPQLEDIYNHQSAISRNLINKVHEFTNNLTKMAGLFDKTQKLQAYMEDIQERPDRYSLSAIQDINNILQDIKSILDDYADDWMSYSELHNNSKFANFMKIAKQCKIFDDSIIKYINNYVHDEFKKVKDNLLLFQISSIGRLCDYDEKRIFLSKIFVDFERSIKELLIKLQMFKEENRNQRNMEFVTLEWNVDKLQGLCKMLAEFNLAQLVQDVPLQPRQAMKMIVRNVLVEYINNSIENSLIEHYKKYNIDHIIDNLKRAVPFITKIIAACDAYECKVCSNHIKTILKHQIEYLFTEIKQQIDSDQLYNPIYISSNPTHAKMQLAKDRAILVNIYKEIAPVMKMYAEQWPSYEWSDNAMMIVSISHALSSGALDELEAYIDVYRNIDRNDLNTCCDAMRYKTDKTNVADFIESRRSIVSALIETKVNQIILENVRTIYPRLAHKFKAINNFFPFASRDNPDIPEHILQDFYNIWAMYRDNIRYILQICNKSAILHPWYQFLCKLEKCMRWYESILEPNQYKSSIRLINRTRREFEKNMKYVKTFAIEFADNQISAICDINNTIELDRINYTNIAISSKLATGARCTFKDNLDENAVRYSGRSAILRFILSHLAQIQHQQIYLCFKSPICIDNTSMNEMIGWCTIELMGHIQCTSENDFIDFNFDEINPDEVILI